MHRNLLALLFIFLLSVVGNMGKWLLLMANCCQSPLPHETAELHTVINYIKTGAQSKLSIVTCCSPMAKISYMNSPAKEIQWSNRRTSFSKQSSNSSGLSKTRNKAFGALCSLESLQELKHNVERKGWETSVSVKNSPIILLSPKDKISCQACSQNLTKCASKDFHYFYSPSPSHIFPAIECNILNSIQTSFHCFLITFLYSYLTVQLFGGRSLEMPLRKKKV